MSDLETVMERLLTDPSFSSALAANPDAALRGYTLSSEERELLSSQLDLGDGAERLVETRTTKSGVAGLLGPVVAALGVAGGGSFGSAGGSGNQSLGAAPGPGSDSFGNAPNPAGGSESFGAAGDGSEAFGTAENPTETMGEAGTGTDAFGSAEVEAKDYRTHVDVDGDGAWDRNTAFERADGGVDIRVDLNRDGIVDFVGHDYDRDGLVDVAEFDNDLDGVMDTRMYDETGDGWMDRSEPISSGKAAPEDSDGFGSPPVPAG
jgi:hypothetical protein